MKSMFEIYNNYANQYDELINHEDYNNNLKKYLGSKIDWNDKYVCEFGVGTGRVTKLYIEKSKKVFVYDNSQNMIMRAKENLLEWNNKIQYDEMDNKNIEKILGTYDIVIEGWSFGHLVVSEKDNKDYWINYLIDNSIRLSKEKIIIIETMGTNVEFPKSPGETLDYFYNVLRNKGFKEEIIETDYKFPSYSDAARIMGNFFGESMKENIIENEKEIIKEYTGVWIYN